MKSFISLLTQTTIALALSGIQALALNLWTLALSPRASETPAMAGGWDGQQGAKSTFPSSNNPKDHKSKGCETDYSAPAFCQTKRSQSQKA